MSLESPGTVLLDSPEVSQREPSPLTQDHGAYHLYDKDQRDPDAKQGLACLVPEKVHAGEPTGGSPDEAQTDKGSFFDAPFMIGSFPFIDTEADEGYDGGNDNIRKYYSKAQC